MIIDARMYTKLCVLWCLTFLVVFLSGCDVFKSPELPGEILEGTPRSALVQISSGGAAPYSAHNPKFPCERISQLLQGLPERRIATLWNTFGRSFKCLDKWAAEPGTMLLESHLVNEVGHRNQRLGSYEVLYGISVPAYRQRLIAEDAALLNKIRVDVQPLADWYNAHPEVQCYVSAGLESNLPKQAYKVLVDHLRPVFPSWCNWVWNPVNNNPFGSSRIEGMVHELHGDTPKLSPECIANLDGTDIDLPSRPAIGIKSIPHTQVAAYLSRYASCDAGFLWIAEFNAASKGPFVDPRKRKNWPKAKSMQELRKYLMAPAQTVPPWDANDELGKAGCKEFVKVSDGPKKGFLWKQSEPPCCNRGAVTFLPTKINNKPTPVDIPLHKVFVKKGKETISAAFERGVYTEDGSNRQFWRFHRLAEDFPYNVVAHYGKICAVIPNPRVRND